VDYITIDPKDRSDPSCFFLVTSRFTRSQVLSLLAEGHKYA